MDNHQGTELYGLCLRRAAAANVCLASHVSIFGQSLPFTIKRLAEDHTRIYFTSEQLH